jgi:putative ABC transport system ATP-binding protein
MSTRPFGNTEMKKLVEIENLWKIYRVGKVEYAAIRGVNMEISDGKFVGMVGRSGSGKSTLLQLIGGLDKPTRGRVIVDGVDLSKLNSEALADYRNKKIGFVFQFFNLIRYLSAVENVELSMSINNIGLRIRREKALELLKMFGIESMAYKKPTELSGGEQQRVAIARALVNEPSLILADEPTGNIDSETGKKVMGILRNLVDEKGVTIIMVTHDMSFLNLFDRTIKLADGQMIDGEVYAS